MDLTTHQGAIQWLCRATAQLKSVPSDATADTDRDTDVNLLKVSDPLRASLQEAELAGQATTANLYVIFCLRPNTGTTIDERHIVVINDIEYRVRAAQKWPAADPLYYKLLAEAD